MLAILDGEVQDAAQARIPATDEGLLRGDGVFEVIRLYENRPFALDDHLERMQGSANGLRLEIDVMSVRRDIETLLADNDEPEAALRFVCTRGGLRLGIVEQLPAQPPTIALGTVEYVPTRVLDAIKSLSYAANMLVNRLAKEQGADLALLVTPHGRVLEGATSSFFVSLDGERLVTPPLEDHVLDSITRRRLLELVGVEVRPVTRDDLRDAREAFLASTLREVHPVHRIDALELPHAPGPLTTAAATAMAGRIRSELGLDAG